jgi:NADH-quinone oxidoreductase subunit M
MIMAMLAGCGLPGFAGFPGEMLVLFGNWQRSEIITGLAVWGALVIAGVYMLRAIRDIWHGNKEWSGLSDVPTFWRKVPYGLLLGGLIVFGCFPRLLTDNIKASVAPVVASLAAGATDKTPAAPEVSPK